VHGSKDRAKDASPNHMRRFLLVHVSGAYALWRMLTTFPSSAPFWTFAVIGAWSGSRGCCYYNHEPTKTFVPTTPREECCLPENRNAFHRYGTSRRNRFAAKGLLPPAFAPALSLTPPTLCPQVVGTVLLIGHCKCLGTVTRDPRHLYSRVQPPFLLVGVSPERPCLV
jgi:hypothetical protein